MGPARPPRAYPACLLRSHAPLSSGTKGAEVWSASAPGIPLRSRSARPRPPYAGAKGDWDGLR